MRDQGSPIKRLCQLCHATSAERPWPKFGRAKLLLSRDLRAESNLNQGSEKPRPSRRVPSERSPTPRFRRLCHALPVKTRREGSVMHPRGRLPLPSSNLKFAFCNSQFAMSPHSRSASVVSCTVRPLSLSPQFALTQLVFDALLIGYFSAKVRE
ncbi:MAG: hypothetical protein JWP89_1999 [Schlesneria sp.]|nr:hypothetical protein [Schlesneria sp.]